MLTTYLVGGYVYRSEFWHGTCLVDRMVRQGRLSPAARDMQPEDVWEQLAEAEALTDVECRDIDLFPIPVLTASGDLLGEPCAACGVILDDADESPAPFSS